MRIFEVGQSAIKYDDSMLHGAKRENADEKPVAGPSEDLGDSVPRLPTSSKKRSEDRFIPLRSYLQPGCLTYSPPQTPYQSMVENALDLSLSRLLNFSTPLQNKILEPRHFLWKFSDVTRVLDAPDIADNDFWTENIAWNAEGDLACNFRTTAYVMYNLNKVSPEYCSSQLLHATEWLSQPRSHLVLGGDRFGEVIDSSVMQQIAQYNLTSLIPVLDPRRIRTISARHGAEIAAGVYNRVVHIDTRSNHANVWPSLPADAFIPSVLWNRNDLNVLAVAREDGNVQIYDCRNVAQGPLQQYSHGVSVKALQWMEGSFKLLLSGGCLQDRKIKLYNMSSEGKIVCEHTTQGEVSSIQTVDDKHFVFSLGRSDDTDQNLHLWRYNPYGKEFEAVSKTRIYRKDYLERVFNMVKKPNASDSNCVQIACTTNDERLYLLKIQKNELFARAPKKTPSKLFTTHLR